MPTRLTAAFALLLLAPVALAGVVVETDVTIEGKAGATETIYVEGERFRTDTAGGGETMSVIFRDDAMWFLDHDAKRAQKIERSAIAELAAQLDEAMRQMEQLPPRQREMMKKMMSGKRGGMQEAPELRVEKGESIRVGEVACTLHMLYADDSLEQETCAAGDDAVAELREAMGAVRAMADFAEELRKMAANMPFGDTLRQVQATVPEIDGFPVRTRWFNDDGEVTRESTLRSIEKRTLAASRFEVPDDYDVEDLGKQLKKRRR